MLRRSSEFVRRHAGLIRGASAVLLIAALVLFVRLLPADRPLEWLGQRVEAPGAWGPVLFGALFVLTTVLLLPATPIALAAGAVFGPLGGAAVIALASTASGALSFLAGRFLARRRAAERLTRYPRLGTLYRALGAGGGWKIVAAVRLSHVTPFGFQSFLFGMTPVRFVPYLLATAAAMLPGTLLYAYVGHLAAAAVDAASTGRSPLGPWEWAARVGGLALAAAALLYVGHAVRRVLKEEVAAETEPEAVPSLFPPPENGPAGGTAGAGRGWGAVALLVVALLALAAAAWAQVERDRVRQLVGHLFAQAGRR